MEYYDINMRAELEQSYLAFEEGGPRGLAAFLGISLEDLKKAFQQFYKKPIASLDYSEWQFVVTQLIYRINNISVPTNERQSKNLVSATGRLILTQIYNELLQGRMTLEKIRKELPPQVYHFLLQSATHNLLEGDSIDLNQDHLKKLPTKAAAKAEYDRLRKIKNSISSNASTHLSASLEPLPTALQDIEDLTAEETTFTKDITFPQEETALEDSTQLAPVLEKEMPKISQGTNHLFRRKTRNVYAACSPKKLEKDPLGDLM